MSLGAAPASPDNQTLTYTDIGALRRLPTNSPEALRATAQQFESLFIGMWLQSMRAVNDTLAQDSGLSSPALRAHQQMLDQQWAVHLSQAGGIGLQDVIVRQLGGDPDAVEASRANVAQGSGFSLPRPDLRSPRADRVPTPVATPAPAPAEPGLNASAFHAGAFAGPTDFVRGLFPLVQRLVGAAGLPPVAVLAQAALETGWGKHVIHDAQGQPTHNLFGIKADNWPGDAAEVVTLEYRDGAPVTERAAFRVYPDWAASIRDYVQLLVNSPRYAGALQRAQDPRAFADQLQQAGYATDPDYAGKLKRVAAAVTRLLE